MKNLFSFFTNEEENTNEKSNADKKLVVVKARCPQNHQLPSVRICPTNALTQKGYQAPSVDMDKCIKCGKCVRFCPMGAIVLN